MGFKEAVRTCLRDKYATFSGRASRSEFWWFMLFGVLITAVFSVALVLLAGFGNIVAIGPDAVFTGGVAVIGIAFLVVSAALIVPFIAVFVRRFHDINLSGWWYLACIIGGFVPLIGLLATLAPYVVGLIKGTPGDNKFGPDPLIEQNTADVFA